MTNSIVDDNGRRKYLNKEEREKFIESAKIQKREIRTFVLFLLYTGVRVSEALEVTTESFDLQSNIVIIRSLKKRNKTTYRQIPLSPEFADNLDLVHNITRSKKPTRLWNVTRQTGYNYVSKVMDDAGIRNIHRSPHTLRHTFCVYALLQGIDATAVKRWAGHSSLKTTEIYLQVVGADEHQLASKMW